MVLKIVGQKTAREQDGAIEGTWVETTRSACPVSFADFKATRSGSLHYTAQSSKMHMHHFIQLHC